MPDATRTSPRRPAETPNNVPPALSSFVGRTDERTELARALGEARLVTVTGPGGAGKTRLAREVAAAVVASHDDERQHRFPHGVWWVELAPIGDPSEVPAAVAAVLGVRPNPGRDITDAIADVLLGADIHRRTLLVLDNCEHVIGAAAVLAERLLRAVPTLTILATSREALVVEGERAWILPPLASPPPTAATEAAIARFDAVRLFVERARGASPTFALTDRTAPAVAAIASRLDGLPLALELAAARVGTLGVEQLAARLHDAFTLLDRGRRTALPRHRTLRALLDWSYALLSERERLVLARLATFRGPFTLDAAETVGAGGAGDPVPDAASAVHALSRLVEQSLVEVRDLDGETRFRMLETVKQYGLARLAEDPSHERAARARHAAYVCALSERAAPATWSAARGRSVARQARDVDDIRAALDWAVRADGDASLAVRIGAALAWFWYSAVSWSEARSRTAAILAAAERSSTDDARPATEQASLAELLYPISGLSFFAGVGAEMLTAGERALALWDSVDAAIAGDQALGVALRSRAVRGRSVMHQMMGLGYAILGQADAALAAMNASVAVARAGEDRWMEAVMIARRALAHAMCGNAEAALTDYETALPLLRAVGEMWFLSLALEGMAAVELTRGAFATAAAHARDSIAVLRDEPDPWFISRSLDTLAAILTTVANPADPLTAARATDAARLSGAATALRARCGAEVMGADAGRRSATIAASRHALGETAFQNAWKSGEALDVDGVFALIASDPARLLASGSATARSGRRGVDAPSLTVHALGPLVVARDGEPLAPGELPAGKATELLLFLALHPDGCTKEQIGLALWPDASASQLRANFHVTLHHLRRALSGFGDETTPQWISFANGRYRLLREAHPPYAHPDGAAVALDCDIDAVLAASETLRRAERRQETLEASTLDALARTLQRRRGALGEGLSTGDWLLEHEDRVRIAWGHALEALARQFLRAARRRDAETLFETLVASEPLRESAHRELMELWAAAGERARALGHYDSLVTRLARDVGSAPARETQALAHRIRSA